MSPVSRSDNPDGVTAELPIPQSGGGGSGSFLVAADDGNRYWCKSLNNLQVPRVPVTEQIVGRFGMLIGAPVCKPRLVLLDRIVGWEFRHGHFVEPGWAHGSLAVDPAIETRALQDRGRDDNRVRHAGFFALHDWLGGTDAQWLFETSTDNTYYSHDHGHYLTGPDWTDQVLAQRVADDFSLGVDSSGIDSGEVTRLADQLEGLEKRALESAISGLPTNWPVSNGELEAAVDFADQRRTSVATRLRALVP